MQPLLTQDEVADLLKLSVRTVERLRVSGTGPKFRRILRSTTQPHATALIAVPASGLVVTTSVSVVAGVALKGKAAEARAARRAWCAAGRPKETEEQRAAWQRQREPNPQIVALRAKVEGNAIVEALKLRR
jgi:hypothetical protein